MASDKIKGLTVKIGADTSDFIKELKKVDKEINTTNKQANELQKGLELEFNEGRFIQAQKLVQQSLEQTEEKARAIREQLRYLEDTGAVNTEGYKKLQTELYKAENNAVLLKQKLEDINNVKTTPITAKIKNFVTNLKASTIAAGALIGGIYKITTSAASAAGNIQDMADRLGVTAELIQRYDYIALQSGVDTEQLVKSMAKARDAIGTSLSGTSNTATQVLEKLFGDLSRIPTSTEAGFNAIIEQLSKVEDSTMQAYYANEIFGERLATNLIPLINNGADRIDQLNKEFEQLGSLTNEEVKELADFDDELNKIKKEFQNISYQLAENLLPLVREFTGFIEEVIVPSLEGVTAIIKPILDAITWINNTWLGKAWRVAVGEGWLYGTNPFDTTKANENENSYNENSYNYSNPNNNTSNNTTNNYEDNSTINVEINSNLTGDLNYDAKQLADEVIKQIVVKKQANGR